MLREAITVVAARFSPDGKTCYVTVPLKARGEGDERHLPLTADQADRARRHRELFVADPDPTSDDPDERDPLWFTTHNGAVIDPSNFNTKWWRPAMDALAPELPICDGLQFRHLRHAGITRRILDHDDTRDIADEAGNTEAVIRTSYRGVVAAVEGAGRGGRRAAGTATDTLDALIAGHLSPRELRQRIESYGDDQRADAEFALKMLRGALNDARADCPPPPGRDGHRHDHHDNPGPIPLRGSPRRHGLRSRRRAAPAVVVGDIARPTLGAARPRHRHPGRRAVRPRAAVQQRAQRRPDVPLTSSMQCSLGGRSGTVYDVLQMPANHRGRLLELHRMALSEVELDEPVALEQLVGVQLAALVEAAPSAGHVHAALAAAGIPARTVRARRARDELADDHYLWIAEQTDRHIERAFGFDRSRTATTRQGDIR